MHTKGSDKTTSGETDAYLDLLETFNSAQFEGSFSLKRQYTLPNPLLNQVNLVIPNYQFTSYNWEYPDNPGPAGSFLTSQGGTSSMTWTFPGSGGIGTVTSVGLTVPSFLSVSGSPITSAGTLAITGSSTGTGSVVLQTSPTITSAIVNGHQVEVQHVDDPDFPPALQINGGLQINKNFYLKGDYNDERDTGLVASVACNVIDAPVLSATNPTVYTSATSLAVIGNPIAGTNVTLPSGPFTNLAMTVEGGLQGDDIRITGTMESLGDSSFEGNVNIGSDGTYLIPTVFFITNTSQIISTNTSTYFGASITSIGSGNFLYIGQNQPSGSFLPVIQFQGSSLNPLVSPNPLLTLSVVDSVLKIPSITWGSMTNPVMLETYSSTFWGTIYGTGAAPITPVDNIMNIGVYKVGAVYTSEIVWNSGVYGYKTMEIGYTTGENPYINMYSNTDVVLFQSTSTDLKGYQPNIVFGQIGITNSISMSSVSISNTVTSSYSVTAGAGAISLTTEEGSISLTTAGAGLISITSAGGEGAIAISSTAAAGNIAITSAGAEGGISITASGGTGNIAITAEGAEGAIAIASTGATGGVAISSAGAANAIAITSDGADGEVVINAAGANGNITLLAEGSASEIILNAAGAGSTISLSAEAGAGGIELTSAGGVSGITLTSGGVASGAILLEAAGANASITLNATGVGASCFFGAVAASSDVQVGSKGGGDCTIFSQSGNTKFLANLGNLSFCAPVGGAFFGTNFGGVSPLSGLGSFNVNTTNGLFPAQTGNITFTTATSSTNTGPGNFIVNTLGAYSGYATFNLKGYFNLQTNSSGYTISFDTSQATTNYSFVYPQTAGTVGQLLASGGGVSRMYWTNAPTATSVVLPCTPTGSPPVSLYNITLSAASATSNYTFTYPVNAGLPGQLMITDGSSQMSWTYSPTFQTSFGLKLSSSPYYTTTFNISSSQTSNYNFNLPITSGNSGDVLTSQGGGTTAMVWTPTSVSSSAPNTIILKDSNSNVSANSFISSVQSYTSSSSPINLVVSSSSYIVITGTSVQIINLPNATTLVRGQTYNINNNSTLAVSVYANDGTTSIKSIPSGGYTSYILTNNVTTNGTWDTHSTLSQSTSSGTSLFNSSAAIQTSSTFNLQSGSYVTSISGSYATGSYNFNLPATAGVAGQVLTSQGGGSNAMTWSNSGAYTVQSYASSGTQIVLTSSSANYIVITGFTNQSIQLPNATTMTNGQTFFVNNTSGATTSVVTYSTSIPIGTIPAGGTMKYVLTSNATADGTWNVTPYLSQNSVTTGISPYITSTVPLALSGTTLKFIQGSYTTSLGVASPSSSFTFTLPDTPGTAGQPLLSGAGSTTTWGNLTGTGILLKLTIGNFVLSAAPTLTGAVQLNGSLTTSSGGSITTATLTLTNPLSIASGGTGKVNIVQYGADPTGVSDSTSAIQAAFNYITSSGIPGTVYAPAGTFKVSSTITVNMGGGAYPISFIGAGSNCTIFSYSGTGACISLSTRYIQSISWSGFKIISSTGAIVSGRNGLIVGTAGSPSGPTANSQFDDIQIQYCDYGYIFYDALIVCFKNVTADSCNNGFVMQRNSFSNPNLINLISCRFTNNIVYGATIANGTNVKFDTCDFEANGNHGTTGSGGCIIYSQSGTLMDGGGNTIWTNCYFEHNGGYDAYILTGSNSDGNSSYTFQECNFDRIDNATNFYTTNNIYLGLSTGSVQTYLIVNGCSFNGYSPYVASSSRPYINVVTAGAPYIFQDGMGSNIYSNSIEIPTIPTTSYGTNMYLNYLDTTSSQLHVGYNTPKSTGSILPLAVYNNSSDRTLLFGVQSAGTSSGANSIAINAPISLGGAGTGTSGYYLVSGGPSSPPTWVSTGGGTFNPAAPGPIGGTTPSTATFTTLTVSASYPCTVLTDGTRTCYYALASATANYFNDALAGDGCIRTTTTSSRILLGNNVTSTVLIGTNGAYNALTVNGGCYASDVQVAGFIAPSTQGSFMGWNRISGSGSSCFYNQRGGGGGGWEWVGYNSSNTLEGTAMTLGQTGNLNVTGSLASSGFSVSSSGVMVIGSGVGTGGFTAGAGSGTSPPSYIGTSSTSIAAGAGALNFGTGTVNTNQWCTFYNSSNAAIGSIFQNGLGGTTFSTTSDYRIKTNITTTNIDTVLSNVMKIQIHDYNYTSLPDAPMKETGIIADELQILFPQLVSGEKDETDDNGNPKYQQVDLMRLAPLLIACVQSQQNTITNLQTQLNLLETSVNQLLGQKQNPTLLNVLDSAADDYQNKRPRLE